MSRRVDEERKEESVAARLEVAKERLRFAQAVLTAWVGGADVEASAARLGKPADAVARVWAWLGVTSGRQTGCKAMAPRASVSSIREVQP